ncbi:MULTISPECIES: hypothetical protein [Bradyrhizobium]|jgi:hypothetical protein|uniref:HhH-GPD domain-containing protein n=2 Tax=Bradyrhizobium TaxID=374 RepID=A0ABY0PT16_9BRAD|nr:MULTISPECIES: hypothetical protein [Bradyrhizobium]SDI90662.1 hypothetical protein SAMN05444163_4041 [Bradyrhizobium ottawaense]SED09723.1 hypothetical protein SAMN05444171_3122 [Bradyrhizobium lablabi]SHL16188.1 hypothetical protein SAMN05444321_1960 [Bradyrhizobium lablabi]
MMSAPQISSGLLEFYQSAKSWVERSMFAEELRWQANLRQPNFSESDILREHAWVVLNSGFREAVVRKHFDFISLCYCDWQSAQEIHELADVCISAASSAFGNKRKLRAISDMAGIVHRVGFEQLKRSLIEDFFGVAVTLPFIGSITARHLAKNLGIDAAKPDRHLVRLAGQFGYYSVDEMCTAISKVTGDSMSVADIVLWRFQERTSANQITHVG